jgi:outer membrane biosynthesis protein TonB
MTAAFGTLVTSELIAAIAPVVAEIAIAVAIAIIILIVAKNIIERVLPRDTSGAETDTGTETEEGTDKDQGTKPRPGPYGPNGDKRLPGEGDGGGKGIKDVTNQPTKQPGEVTNPQPQPDPTKPPTPPAPPPDEPDDNSNAIYRSMQTENGNWIHSSPVGATNGRQLGARTPESIGKPDDNTAGDIQPVNGMVGPGITQTGLNGEYHGLSTSKHLTSMITKLESGEYKNKEGAVGMLDLRTLPPGLKAVQDSPGGHVTIYPSEVMTIEEYINKLNSLQWIPVYRKNK